MLYEARENAKRKIWDLLPPSPVFTKTDADGKFVLAQNVSEKFIVGAFGSRLVGKDVERYQWFVSSDDIPSSGQFFLSNDNLD